MKRTIINIFPYVLIIMASLFISGCSNEENPIDNNEPETEPVIENISADKSEILYGGNDKATLTCNAKGGNLTYVWQVDLGDLIPLNASRSKVSFTGAECCVGDKIITCTVSNSKGSVSKSITVKIIEVEVQPEVITIESDKSELVPGETANLVCYALGGNLKYKWEADCGDVVVNEADNSKISYTAKSECSGSKSIKCTVSNSKGSHTQTFQILVK